ncbi:hypothetical protein SDC9_177058 [bioreactor metagenome]|uniref:Uncharacterized protein n=1 Tax=bioreactor metagenome TaxID=1076179 RepID=A0A645GS88_9ZZZZ
MGVLFADGFVIQTHLSQGSGTVAGYKHVGLGQQLIQNRQALGSLEIERKPPLVGVVGVIPGVAVPTGGGGHGCARAPSGIAEAGLDLDDVGAPVGQDLRGAGTGNKIGQVKDLNALQRLEHINYLTIMYRFFVCVKHRNADVRPL